MFSLIYQDLFYKKLDFFIESSLKNHLDRFSDTWIENEFLIVWNYIEKSKNFKTSILNSVEKILFEEKILWYSILENNNFEITTIVWNYRLFIEYWEDNDDKIRFVENIRFFNK